MTPHMKRWLTAAVGVPLIFAVLFYGPEELFFLLMVILILAAAAEYNRLIFREGFAWEKAEVLAAAFLIPVAFATGDVHYALLVVTFSVVAAFFFFLLRIRGASFDLAPVSKVVLGIAYIPLLLSYFILMRRATHGFLWVSFVLVLAFSGDMTAYYVGNMLGRRKLFPFVSPGKTVEGAVGSYVGSVTGSIVFQQLFFPMLPMAHAVVLGIAGSTLGQLGDLCESAVKRTAGVKDSGSLLPGHGGLLDRLDCLIFITPFVYYYQFFLIG